MSSQVFWHRILFLFSFLFWQKFSFDCGFVLQAWARHQLPQHHSKTGAQIVTFNFTLVLWLFYSRFYDMWYMMAKQWISARLSSFLQFLTSELASTRKVNARWYKIPKIPKSKIPIIDNKIPNIDSTIQRLVTLEPVLTQNRIQSQVPNIVTILIDAAIFSQKNNLHITPKCSLTRVF